MTAVRIRRVGFPRASRRSRNARRSGLLRMALRSGMCSMLRSVRRPPLGVASLMLVPEERSIGAVLLRVSASLAGRVLVSGIHARIAAAVPGLIPGIEQRIPDWRASCSEAAMFCSIALSILAMRLSNSVKMCFTDLDAHGTVRDVRICLALHTGHCAPPSVQTASGKGRPVQLPTVRVTKAAHDPIARARQAATCRAHAHQIQNGRVWEHAR